MTERPSETSVKTSADDTGPIETSCAAFQTAFEEGRRPSLESFLSGWQEPERSKLLTELLLLELEYATSHGERPSPDAYKRRFPDHGDVIRDAFDQRCSAQLETSAIAMQTKFQMLRPYARGGLGVVYRACEDKLNRVVAVKFIRSTLADDLDSRERFHREAEITSRLDHPGVVPVLGMGQSQDNLFYAMRFIEGETFEEAIKRFHESKGKAATVDQRERQLRELLTQFTAVCKTIAYAHVRGIVHRDIKPKNVMLGKFGETIVIDWGLAIPVDREGVFKSDEEKTLTPISGSDSTIDDGVTGTPGYMSPEQADGKELGPSSDIYSLGAVLYQILVGRPCDARGYDYSINGPFRSKSPSSVKSNISKRLDAVCMKAMSRRPQDRYSTAMDLAHDVENYLRDAPVTAYRESLSEAVARWMRRHRIRSQCLMVVLAFLVLAGVFTAFVLGHQRNREYRLRCDSLSGSAKFAAHTIANNIDIRLRILEHEGTDSALHRLMDSLNKDPFDQKEREPLQDWLNQRGQKYKHLNSRCWFICASDGSQVARFPYLDKENDNQPFSSLAKNYAYRDYFHGEGEDLGETETQPALSKAHISVIHGSTNGGDLTIAFSAPIRAKNGDVLGVIATSTELGTFSPLHDLPRGQEALLVNTRSYNITYKVNGKNQIGEARGVILHHDELARYFDVMHGLAHVNDESIERLLEVRDGWRNSMHQVGNGTSSEELPANLMTDAYRDPVLNKLDSDRDEWLACAPVLLSTRGRVNGPYDTHCFVIVQQSPER